MNLLLLFWEICINFWKGINSYFSSMNCFVFHGMFSKWLLATFVFTSCCTSWLSVSLVIFGADWIRQNAFGLSFWLFDFTLALSLFEKYDHKSLLEAAMSKDHKIKIKTSKHWGLKFTHTKQKQKDKKIRTSNFLFCSN